VKKESFLELATNNLNLFPSDFHRKMLHFFQSLSDFHFGEFTHPTLPDQLILHVISEAFVIACPQSCLLHI
jgi:hypothetical protein